MVLTDIWYSWPCQNQRISSMTGMYHKTDCQLGESGGLSRFFRGPGAILCARLGPMVGSAVASDIVGISCDRTVSGGAIELPCVVVPSHRNNSDAVWWRTT